MHIETVAVHGTQHTGDKMYDVIQPIHLSTTYERKKDGTHNTYSYTRGGNPNRQEVEDKIAALEGAEIAIAFSSGLAAINAIFENILMPGSHIILPDDCYHGTRRLLEKFFAGKNIQFTETDMTDINEIKKNILPSTKLIWIETPSNPQLKIADLAAITALAKQHAILTACDNTFATSLLQKPLQAGIDYVMHSSTKFFSGHSDILGGIVCTNHKNELSENMREYQIIAGAVPSPFDCWLLNRSLATFPLRFVAQCKNAMELAVFLEGHSAVEKVFYPGLASHKNHDLAKKQMQNGFGSIISILIKGGQDEALAFAGNLRIFKHATSLGGVESLAEHRRSAEGNHPLSPDNLIRLSVGIENAEDLKNDLMNALEN